MCKDIHQNTCPKDKQLCQYPISNKVYLWYKKLHKLDRHFSKSTSLILLELILSLHNKHKHTGMQKKNQSPLSLSDCNRLYWTLNGELEENKLGSPVSYKLWSLPWTWKSWFSFIFLSAKCIIHLAYDARCWDEFV